MNRWNWTAWYRSNTMRALLVGLVAFSLDRVGLPSEISQETARHLVELLLGATQGGAMLWGVYARTQQPTPPLTLTQAEADRKNALDVVDSDQEDDPDADDGES